MCGSTYFSHVIDSYFRLSVFVHAFSATIRIKDTKELPVVHNKQCCWAGAGFFCWSRSRWKWVGSRVTSGVLRWQSCGNSYNYNYCYTKWKKNSYTFKRVTLSSFIFPYFIFYSNLWRNFFSPKRSRPHDPELVKIRPAPQHNKARHLSKINWFELEKNMWLVNSKEENYTKISVAEPEPLEPPLLGWLRSRSRFICWSEPGAGAGLFKAAPSNKREMPCSCVKHDIKSILEG